MTLGQRTVGYREVDEMWFVTDGYGGFVATEVYSEEHAHAIAALPELVEALKGINIRVDSDAQAWLMVDCAAINLKRMPPTVKAGFERWHAKVLAALAKMETK
jgi:hypothetical protein